MGHSEFLRAQLTRSSSFVTTYSAVDDGSIDLTAGVEAETTPRVCAGSELGSSKLGVALCRRPARPELVSRRELASLAMEIRGAALFAT
mmetsp:Transcript_38112/g.93458  ORF Transcript_38112/g.93458 Transcript_38112/m.93458 type:complete len:89 (+) Transcript_38112:835-1101(+)